MNRYIYTIFAIVLYLLSGCSDDNDNSSENRQKELITLQAKDIFHNCATLQGVCNNYEEEIDHQGFELLSLAPDNDNTAEEYKMPELKEGKFELRVEGLKRKTDYSVKTFIISKKGEKIYGNSITFRTESMIINPPGKPTGEIAIIDGKTISVIEKGSTLGDSDMTADDKKTASVKPADYGIFYWTEEEGREKAQHFSLGEPLSNLNSITSEVVYKVAGLKPGTKYNYTLYIRTGVYYNNNKWKAFSKEVESEESSFTTMALTDAESTTLDASDITPTSATISGVLVSGGFDPDVKFGIEYGLNSSELGNEVYALGIENESLKTYKVFVKGLKPNTEYYFRAFAENEKNRTGSTIKNFTTDKEGIPVIDEYLLDYEFRVSRYSFNKVVLRAKLLSDGGSELISKGFYYGTSDTKIDTKITTANNVQSDGVFDFYEAELDGIPEGIIYFKPFVQNKYGEVVYEDVCQIRTAVNGGLLYVLDYGKGDTPSYNNMVLSNTKLTYFELDPIVSGSTVYYMLDRNIGATIAYGSDFYDKSFNEADRYPMLFDAAGYYYQFDRPIPSTTPDIKIITNMRDAPYRWTNSANLFTKPPMNTDGNTWTQENCPEGYTIPTFEDLRTIISAIQPVSSNQNLPLLFEATRFGVTGWRAPANGNMVNGSLVTSELWVKDAGTTTAQIMRIGAPPTGTLTSATANRYTGRPIRCIRKVTTN